MKTQLLSKTLIAAMAAMLLGVAGCQADGNGTESGGVVDDGGDNGGFGSNDGTTPTSVGEDTDGDGVTDTDISGNFICTQGAKAFGDVTTAVGSNGLVGGPLTTLLNLLAGNTATTLLNSVTEPDYVIDGHLATYSTFSLTAGLLGGLLSSVDESVLFPSEVPAGNYAVFALSFPSATVDLTLFNTVAINTYLGDSTTPQETKTYSQSDLDLLGLTPDQPAFIGLKAHKPFDRATISVTPGLVSVDVGDAMHVHELCTGGKFVTPPATP